VRKAAPALLLLAAFACKRPAQQAAVTPQEPPPPPNHFQLFRGASVVSRSAELDLDHTPVRMMDGLGSTGWVTPAGDPAQSAVMSLPAPARIDHIGILTAIISSAHDVRFDFSADGENFTRSVTLSAKELASPQIVPVAPPVDAQYIRIATLNGRAPHVFIREVIVNGAFLKPPAAGPIDGCWTVNGQPATFHSDGAAAYGYVGGADDMMLDGGSDGRFYRFAWTRDKEYGLAAMSATPDGKHLASMVWHEQALELEFYADDWLGDRGPCPAHTGLDVFDTYLRRFGYFPLYALRFSDDGTLDDGASAPALTRLTTFLALNPQLQARLVAHELTHPTATDNLAVSQKKIATLRDALSRRGVAVARLTFIAVGEAHPRREAASDLTRAMYSSVDLEVRR
jgi:hypothetical protein